MKYACQSENVAKMGGHYTFLINPYSEEESRSHLAGMDVFLLYDERIVILQALRLEALDSIHRAHLSSTKCCARARMSVWWWPGLSVVIEDMVKACFTCAKELPEPKKPLITSAFFSGSWENISVDLYGGRLYNITVWLLFQMGRKQASHSTNGKECDHSFQGAIRNLWYTRHCNLRPWTLFSSESFQECAPS